MAEGFAAVAPVDERIGTYKVPFRDLSFGLTVMRPQPPSVSSYVLCSRLSPHRWWGVLAPAPGR